MKLGEQTERQPEETEESKRRRAERNVAHKTLCSARVSVRVRVSHTLVRSHNRSTLGNVVLDCYFTLCNDSRISFQLKNMNKRPMCIHI